MINRDSFPPHFATKEERQKAREKFLNFLESQKPKTSSVKSLIELIKKLLVSEKIT